MRKCENCGYENEDNAIKCSRCNYLFIEYEKKNQTIEEKTTITNNNTIVNNDFIYQANSYNDDNGYYEINLSENYNIHNQLSTDNYQKEDNEDINNTLNNDILNNYYIDKQRDIKVNDNNLKHKNPIIGLVLSFIVSGLGNIYAGLYRRGIFQIIISVMLNYLTFYIFPNNMILTMINLIWAFYVMYDSYICIVARNAGKEVPLLLGFIRFKE
ncbi:MAG: hypothetical protein E7Z86_00275 [Methanosphaera stadtmanae]|jgi:hypothetical protein|nr:hypothetical protein [Methanosphaera stadtmanae]